MSATDARSSLPEILDRVEAGEEVTITRHGRPIAVVHAPGRRALSESPAAFGLAADIRSMIEDVRRDQKQPAASLSPVRAEELVEQLRADRDRS